MSKNNKRIVGTAPKITSRKLRDIQIIGENILVDNGTITAYYILPTVNYSVASSDAILRSIQEIYNVITSVGSNRKNMKFTIEKISKVVRAKDVKQNLLETIKIYRSDFELPYEFSSNIEDESQDYCLLGIDIKNKDDSEVEDLTWREVFSSVKTKVINVLNNGFDVSKDLEKILAIEENIYSTLSTKCLRLSKELVFYNYVSKIYPNYEISYDSLSFINENNFENIMGAVDQTISDNFGYFVMHNDGIGLFDLPQQDTYGCVLEVKTLPLVNRLDSFPMNFEGAQLQIRLFEKRQAELKLKRTRANDLHEAKQASISEAEEEDIEESLSSIELITEALQDLKDGDVMCEFNFNILVVDQTLEGLRAKVRKIIGVCKDLDILVVKSLTQADSFVDNYVKNSVKEFEFFAPLYLPLASQLNSGSIVGDIGTGFTSPSIGEDIV